MYSKMYKKTNLPVGSKGESDSTLYWFFNSYRGSYNKNNITINYKTILYIIILILKIV